MSKELPGEWGELLGPKGIHSYRDLAARADLPVGTVHRLITGSTSPSTVNQVADAVFDGDRDLVWRLRGSTRRDFGDWELPEGASLLNKEQRAAVRAVIQAMLPAEREEVTGNAEHPAPMKHAGSAGPRRLNDEERAVAEATRLAQAARRGRSTGRRARAEQDAAAEAPQDDPMSEGSA